MIVTDDRHSTVCINSRYPRTYVMTLLWLCEAQRAKCPECVTTLCKQRNEYYSLKSDEKIFSYAAIASGSYAALEE